MEISEVHLMNKRILGFLFLSAFLVSCGGQKGTSSAMPSDEAKVIAHIGSGFTSINGETVVQYDPSTKYFSSTCNEHNKYWVWAATVVFTWPSISKGSYQSGGEGIGENAGMSYRLSFSNIVLDNGDPRKISSYSYTTTQTTDASGKEDDYTAKYDSKRLSYCVSTFDFCCYEVGVAHLS
jgi:hypothetical protein